MNFCDKKLIKVNLKKLKMNIRNGGQRKFFEIKKIQERFKQNSLVQELEKRRKILYFK
jgi:hypothetical protein